MDCSHRSIPLFHLLRKSMSSNTWDPPLSTSETLKHIPEAPVIKTPRQPEATSITTVASSSSTNENWSCRRGHIIHDVFISYKNLNLSLAFEIAARLELMSTITDRTFKVHLSRMCLNMGADVVSEAINESLPRSKILVILICSTMLEGFKTANKQLSWPLQELEKALELDGRPMILPVFVDMVVDEIKLDEYPNEKHFGNKFSVLGMTIREMMTRVISLKGCYFANIPGRADVEGLVSKIAAQVVSLEQRDSRWKWLAEPAAGKMLYDAFISYRVNTESKLAKALYYVLSSERQAVNGIERGLRIYLDQIRLINGEKWETGFINGLRCSDVVIFLISPASILHLKNADIQPDSVLLEIEIAFDLLDHRRDRTLMIQPVFINGIPEPKDFPDKLHCHPSSPRMATVKNLVRRLVSLQGLRVSVDSAKDQGTQLLEAMESIAPQIINRLQSKWERQRVVAGKILVPMAAVEMDAEMEGLTRTATNFNC
ncbi:hypothetical protein HDU98_009465 [Podochytrium sp. JEL0797]|nr:hypothetical protein HDU98_009465 [Podochytrium sp. JEL0797]